MKFEFPYKGEVSQMNKGEAYGSLHTSYGIDFSTEKGRILSSPASLNILNTDGLSTEQVIAFAVIDSRWIGVADGVYRGGSGQVQDPTNGWAIDGTASTPAVDTLEGDATPFDGYLVVSGISGGGDIYKYDGSAWSSWWTGTLAQAALSTSSFKPMKVGPSGRLYILDSMNKVYNVTTALSVTKTGNGTLDLSDTGYKFNCMAMSSNRMWLGGRDISTGMSIVAEWDMSLNEATVSRFYSPGSTGVRSIVVWNDSPVLMLADGTMRFYDGSSFYSKDGARLLRPENGFSFAGDYVSTSILTLSSFNMHPNGSAIIDELPHFLMSACLRDTSGTTSIGNEYHTVAGIFCYDPEIGLYNRFPIVASIDETLGFGSEIKTTGQMGALIAAPSPGTKFLASAKVWNDTEGYPASVIFSDDNARTLASRGRFVLNPFYGTAKDLWQKVEILGKRLKNSSDRILLKYRLEKSGTKPFKASVIFSSSTSFTSTDTNFQYAEAGDLVLLAYDYGGNESAHISAISYSNPTYTVTLDETIAGFLPAMANVVRVDNFKRLGTISNQKTDYHDISLKNTEGSHTFWLMVELRAAAGSVVELDKIITTSNDGK